MDCIIRFRRGEAIASLSLLFNCQPSSFLQLRNLVFNSCKVGEAYSILIPTIDNIYDNLHYKKKHLLW